jgi:hypothetical protein
MNTGQPTPTSAEIENIDVLNANAALYLLSQKYAYGWSALFLAYGNSYQISSVQYSNAYYTTSPTGTQDKFLNPNCGAGIALPVPAFSVGAAIRSNPYGRNQNGKQIVLYAPDSVDYVSGMQIAINFYSDIRYMPVVTADADFAARSTQDPTVCVIAIGKAAGTRINNAASSLGLSVESFSNYSTWAASPNYGYIYANGYTGTAALLGF